MLPLTLLAIYGIALYLVITNTNWGYEDEDGFHNGKP
jgi:hypothetical protein